MRKVAVIVGSIRKDSNNAKLARALGKLAEGKLEFRTIRIDDLPLFNQDNAAEPPAEVRRFKGEVEACDAVLFVTPEHNRGIPAALKNAFDWGSRPTGKNSWRNKTGAIIGTSGGNISTALAQQNMRTIASGHLTALLGFPDAFVKYQDGMFDADFTVTNEDTRKFLQGFVDGFAKLVNAMADA
jgi:chromate reductase